MLNIKVERKIFNDTCTIGEMFIDGVFHCHTLEDVVRPDGVKVFGQTAIPKGKYEVVINHSNHFNKDLPELLKVPMFDGIRIHGGNTDADTEGCILVGAASNGKDEISICAGVLQSLIEKIKASSECWIEIT